MVDNTRVQVDPTFTPRQFGFAEELQPAATPVDTYVRPASPSPSSLNGLAQSLSNFSGDLDGYMKQRQAKDDARDKTSGEAAAYKANGVGYAEAVRSGSVATYNSPTFVQSYKEAQGAIAGKQLAAGALDAYQTWPQRNSQDPNNFDTFMGQYLKQNLNTDDPDVLAGAMPYVKSTSDSLYSANEKERSDQLYQSSVSTHIAASSMDIDNEQDVSLTQSRTPNYDATWQQLMADRDKALASGIRADDYDKSMVEMIHSKALEYMDPGLLGMLKNNVPGQTYSYDNQDGGKSTQDTLTTMEGRQATVDRAKAEAQTKQDKQDLDNLSGQVIGQLSKDPAAPIDPAIIAQGVKLGDGAFAVHIKEWSKTLANPEPEDPNAIMHIQQQIVNGAGMGVITDNLGANGAIHDPATLSKMIELNNSVQSKDMQPVLSNETVKQGLNYLRQSFTDPTNFANPSGTTPDAIQAQTDFTLSMAAWLKANPNANYADISTQATKVLKDMNVTSADSGKYVRPAAVTEDLGAAPAKDANGQPNTSELPPVVKPPVLTPDAAGQEHAANADAAGKAADAPANPWSRGTPPTMDQLPQDQKDKINERAASLGVDPQVIIDRVFTHRDGFVPKPPAATDAAAQPNADGYVRPPTADGSEGDTNVTLDPTKFVEPAANPDVQPAVLKSYAGKPLPAIIRLNNSAAVSITGNVANSWAAKQPGFVGVVARPKKEGGYYAKYATPEYGVAAADKLLQHYGAVGVDTPLEIVRKWSTGSAAWGSYAATLVKYLKQAGISASSTSPLDLKDPKVRVAILKGQSAHESGAGVPVYSDAVYERALTI